MSRRSRSPTRTSRYSTSTSSDSIRSRRCWHSNNPITDRLDLIWYTNGSAGLRDKVVAANDRYAIGVTPLIPQFAPTGDTILDAAPFGLAGIPAIALVERYGEPDSTFPGNFAFHTVNDTPDHVSNRRLWLKAAKLTLAAGLDLATAN